MVEWKIPRIAMKGTADRKCILEFLAMNLCDGFRKLVLLLVRQGAYV